MLAAPAPDSAGHVRAARRAPLADRLSAVDVVRRDLLIFGGIALAASWLVGALAARPPHPADPPARVGGRADRGRGLRGAHRGRGQRTRWPSWPGRSTACAFGSRTSTRRAGSSSAMPRTSSGRRCSRSAASSSCSRTRISTRRTRRDFLETARGQVDRLTRLATDLLDLSRLDAGQLGLERGAGRPGRDGTALAEEFGPLAEATGHELGVADGADAVGLGDEQRVLRDRPLARRERVSAHARGYRRWSCARRSGSIARSSSVHDDGPGHRAGGPGAGVRALLPRARARRPRAAASAWRSRGSSPSAWAGRSSCARSPARRRSRSRWRRAAVAAFSRENALVLEP